MFRHLIALAVVVGGTMPCEAQWSPATGVHRFSVAAGPARLAGGDAIGAEDGIAGLLAFEVISRRHLEVRLTGTVYEGRGARPAVQLGGVGVDAAWFPARNRWQPYVSGGAGAYAMSVDAGGGGERDIPRDQASFAVAAAGGLRVRMGRLTPFMEARYTVLLGGHNIAQSYAPIVAGLHF